MAVDKPALVYALHDNLLEFLCNSAGQRHTGVAAAARDLKQQKRVSSSLCSTLTKFDWSYNFLRHLTTQHVNQFYYEVTHTVAPPQATSVSGPLPSTVVDVSGGMYNIGDDDDADTVYPSSLADS